jgi:hypothetical protein
MTDQRWRAERAWRSVTIALLLHIGGMPLDMLIARTVPGIPLWPEIGSIAIGVVLLAALFVRRKHRTARFANIVFLLDVVAIAGALWLTNPYYAESGRPWVPFQANKLGMVTVALLAPEIWVGLPSVAIYGGLCVIQMHTFSEAALSRFAIGEPMASIIIGVFSGALLVYRLKRLALERELVRAHTEEQSMATFAKTMLAIRDLSNTPLQTIAFASAAARIEYPAATPALDRIDAALAEIKAIGERLREYERGIAWMSDDESFDAAAWLERSDSK